MTPTEENQIVERALKGEREAFAALVDAYKGAIFTLAFRMTNSYQDADDLSQEIFIRAYRNLRQFDPRKRLMGFSGAAALMSSAIMRPRWMCGDPWRSRRSTHRPCAT